MRRVGRTANPGAAAMGSAGYGDTLGPMPITSRDAFRRLVATAETGDLGDLCRRQHIELLVVFGSAAREGSEPIGGVPGDVDLGVAAEYGARVDVLSLLDELYGLTDYEGFDVLDLDRAGPMARERALVGARLLHQERPGVFARRQIAAIMERLDTDWLRRLELELMTQ